MHQLEFLQNLHLDPTKQLSTQLAKQNIPLFLNPTDNLEQRKKLITLYLAYHNMIITQGQHEHTNDWDPALAVTLNDNTKIGDEPGYDIANISGDNLLLEHPNDDGENPDENEDCYYTIPILDIQSLSFYYH